MLCQYRAETFARFTELHLSEPNVFLISFSNGGVVLEEKPISARHATYDESLIRARLYRDFFKKVTGLYCPTLSTTVAMFVGDGALETPDVPVFAFQKPVGNVSPLMPDVDLINEGFFENSSCKDTINYHSKPCIAIFCGSTTGGHISCDAISRGTIPRIRAADYFSNVPDVQFHLSRITPCDAASEEMLRQRGYGTGEFVSWKQQFDNRFLLSIDGNGPSCGRIAIGLNSNSVLMQYRSDHELFYFPGLRPWLHYLPIERDIDVNEFLKQEMSSPGTFQHIADAAKVFSQNFLMPSPVMKYAAELLVSYDNMLKRN